MLPKSPPPMETHPFPQLHLDPLPGSPYRVSSERAAPLLELSFIHISKSPV